MKQFLELGGGLVVTGGVLGIGAVARVVLWVYYGLLGHACKRLDITKNGTVKYMREDLRDRLEKGTGIRSVAMYTENCMTERKFAGIRIGTWESISMQSVLLAMITGAVCSLGGVLWECEGKRILEMLFAAGGSAVVLLAMDLVFGIEEKHKRTRICLREHIENVWLMGIGFDKAEMSESILHSDKKEERKIARSEAKEAKTVLKESKRNEKSGKQKNVGKKHCKAQEEKRRLTEELLRERRQLEARQIAERKKSETVIQNVPKTDSESEKSKPTEMTVENASYESLLRNVLAEYLA